MQPSIIYKADVHIFTCPVIQKNNFMDELIRSVLNDGFQGHLHVIELVFMEVQYDADFIPVCVVLVIHASVWASVCHCIQIRLDLSIIYRLKL